MVGCRLSLESFGPACGYKESKASQVAFLQESRFSWMCLGRSRNVGWSSAKAQILLQASQKETEKQRRAELRNAQKSACRRSQRELGRRARLAAVLGQRPRSGLELGGGAFGVLSATARSPPSRKSSSAGSSSQVLLLRDRAGLHARRPRPTRLWLQQEGRVDEQQRQLMSEEAPSKAPQDARGHSPQGTAGQNHHGGRGTEKRVLIGKTTRLKIARAPQLALYYGRSWPKATRDCCFSSAWQVAWQYGNGRELQLCGDQIWSRAALADSPMSTKEQRKGVPLATQANEEGVLKFHKAHAPRALRLARVHCHPGLSRGRPGIGRAASSAPPGRCRCSGSSPAGPSNSAPPHRGRLAQRLPAPFPSNAF